MNAGTSTIRTRVASTRIASVRPDAEHPHERHLRGDQCGERDRHQQRGGGHDAAGAGQAERDAFVVVGAAPVVAAGAPASQYSRIRETRNTS